MMRTGAVRSSAFMSKPRSVFHSKRVEIVAEEPNAHNMFQKHVLIVAIHTCIVQWPIYKTVMSCSYTPR